MDSLNEIHDIVVKSEKKSKIINRIFGLVSLILAISIFELNDKINTREYSVSLHLLLQYTPVLLALLVAARYKYNDKEMKKIKKILKEDITVNDDFDWIGE